MEKDENLGIESNVSRIENVAVEMGHCAMGIENG